MEDAATQTPERFAEFMWLLEHVGVPLAIGLLVGVLVRSIIKSVLILGLLFGVALVVMAKTGGQVTEEQVEQAGSIIPTLRELTAAGWRMLRSSPAAVIGLVTGFVLREKWRHRRAG